MLAAGYVAHNRESQRVAKCNVLLKGHYYIVAGLGVPGRGRGSDADENEVDRRPGSES